MAWEYLKTKEFDIRYKIVADIIDVKDKVIMDLNCGEPNFQKYINGYKEYICNDLEPIENKDVRFLQVPDIQIDIKADIYTLWGYGGGELTGQPLESHTIREKLVELVNKYSPNIIVVEMVQKWRDMGAIDWFNERFKNYKITFQKEYDIEPITHYHNQRIITIWNLQDKNT